MKVYIAAFRPNLASTNPGGTGGFGWFHKYSDAVKYHEADSGTPGFEAGIFPHTTSEPSMWQHIQTAAVYMAAASFTLTTAYGIASLAQWIR